jgi:DNA repair protein RecO (recombination protein O)
MPYLSTTAFVLGSSKFKEQDKLVYLLTLDQGIIKAVAPGALKTRNRFGSLFELFTEGEFTCYIREGRDLLTVSKGEIIKSFFDTVSAPASIFYFYLVAEIITRFVPFKNRDSRVYRLLKSVLLAGESQVPPRYLILYFLVWILKIEGMLFKPGLCYSCFSPIVSDAWLKDDYLGILCLSCRQNERRIIRAVELDFLRWCEKNPPAQLSEWTGRIESNSLIQNLVHKIEHHGEFSLKTSSCLKEFSR